jgi:hypothetical protein
MPARRQFRLPEARPRWRGTLGRSLYVGLVVGALSGFLTLLVGLVAVLVAGGLAGPVDIRVVYREIAPRVAAMVAVVAFLGNAVWERTHPVPVATGERTSA